MVFKSLDVHSDGSSEAVDASGSPHAIDIPRPVVVEDVRSSPPADVPVVVEEGRCLVPGPSPMPVPVSAKLVPMVAKEG